MAVSNVNPASGETLTFGAEFSFEVTDGYTSLLVRVTTDGGVLEAAYDDGAGPGYSVSIVDLGATHRVTVLRDAGWNDDPMTVHVTENGTATTSWTYDIFPTQAYPEGMRPYNDAADGETAGVLTFEGRSGNVNSAVGDYDSDEVINQSGVAGSTVTEALDALDAEEAPVTSVHGRTGVVVAAASDYDASQVDNDSDVTGATVKDALNSLETAFDDYDEGDLPLLNPVGFPTISTQEDLNTVSQSTSRVNGGGTITDDGDGTVTVSVGYGLLRATDSDTAVFHKVDWAETPLTPTDEQLNFIYFEWNAGVPQMVITTAKRTDLNTNIFIGTVHRSGTFLHPTTHVTPTGNVSAKLTKRFNDTQGLTRASGSVNSEVGTRNLAVTAGAWWHGLDEVSIAAFDTSVADTFLYFYRDGVGGWTVVSGQTQIDNTQYDDGDGTLGVLSPNRYGVHWVYVGVDDHLYVIYGRGDYTSSQWPDAIPPGDIPPHMQEQHAGIIGRIVIQDGAATFTDIATAFDNDFSTGGVSDHGDLAGLSDDDHSQYYLVDGTRAAATLYLAERAAPLNTPADGWGELWADDHANGERLRWTVGKTGIDYVVPKATSFSNSALIYWSGVTGDIASSSLYTFNGNRTWINSAGGSHHIKEAAALVSAPAAASGAFWVRNDVPNRAMFTDDTPAAHVLAYEEEHPNVDGTTVQDALFLTSRADHVNVVSAGKAELWSRTAGLLDDPMWTDELGVDWVIARGSDPSNFEIPFWNVSANGSYLNQQGDFTYNTGLLKLQSATAGLVITERASAPAHEVANGTLWVDSVSKHLFITTSDDSDEKIPFMSEVLTNPMNEDLDAADFDITSISEASFAEKISVAAPTLGEVKLWAAERTPNLLIQTDDADIDAALVQRPGYRYEYDSTTTPGSLSAGLLRFNNATQASATKVYIYYTDKDGVWNNSLAQIEPGCTLDFVKEHHPAQRIQGRVSVVNDASIGEGPSYMEVDIAFWNQSTDWLNMSDAEKLYLSVTAAGSARSSATFQEESALVAETSGSNNGHMWLKDDAIPLPKWEDDAGNASRFMMWDTNDDGADTTPTDGQIAVYQSAAGKFSIPPHSFLLQSGELKNLSTTASYTMVERATAPGHSSGRGKLWCNSAYSARPYWTQDEGSDRPVVLGPTGATPVGANIIPRWDSTSGGVLKNSELYQGDNGNTTIGGSIADLSILERATGPGSAGGYSRIWTHTESPTRLCVTDDSGYKAKLGYKDIRLSCRADIGGTTNYWYTWNTAGPHYDYIWSHPASGSTTYSLSNCWMNTTCMYFPRKTRIISVEACLTYKDATNTANIDFYMVHSAATEAQTAANSINTCAYWLPATFAAVANKRYLSGKWVLSDTTIPAGSQVWILHRRTTSTVVAADPYIDYTIHYIEEAD